MVRGEYRIAEPTKCVKHSNITKINCSADIYYPQWEFVKIPMVACDLYKTVSETKHYFFGAKVNDKNTRPTAAPSVATCTQCARSLEASCCGKLTTQSGNTWSANNKPKIVYVWPTSHKESVLNAVVIKSTPIYNYLHKKLTSPLNGMSNYNAQKGSCVTCDQVHVWSVPKRIDCPNVNKSKKSIT